jgi:ribosome-binding ATPase YchF (GTP1/OBG family)
MDGNTTAIIVESTLLGLALLFLIIVSVGFNDAYRQYLEEKSLNSQATETLRGYVQTNNDLQQQVTALNLSVQSLNSSLHSAMDSCHHLVLQNAQQAMVLCNESMQEAAAKSASMCEAYVKQSCPQGTSSGTSLGTAIWSAWSTADYSYS